MRRRCKVYEIGNDGDVLEGPAFLHYVKGCDCRDCIYARLPGIPLERLPMPQGEIAAELHISEGRVSQLIASGLAKLEASGLLNEHWRQQWCKEVGR